MILELDVELDVEPNEVYHTGSVVMHYNGTKMTVADFRQGVYRCVWFENTTMKAGDFIPEQLLAQIY